MKIYNFKVSAFLIVSLITAICSSCSNPEGYGGTSSVSGTIVTLYYNDDYSELMKESPAIDENVFLIFGNEENVGDKVATGATGTFAFKFLFPGNYTLYFMGEDSSTVDRKEVVRSFDFELKGGEDKDLGLLYELKSLDYNDGTGKISGVVRLINYKNTSVFPFLVVKDTSYAQEQEVYIMYGNHKFYDDRIRTNYNGYFEFDKLINGVYKVFTYSEDVSGGTEKYTVGIDKPVTISDDVQDIDLGILYIEKL